MDDFSAERLSRLTGILKRRGVILPSFEIHGGAAGLYDFGPVGGRLRNRVNQTWIDHWLSLGNIVEISCPTVTPYAVLEASGHVGEFSDFLTECKNCGEASRADHLVEDVHPKPPAPVKKKSRMGTTRADSTGPGKVNPNAPAGLSLSQSKSTRGGSLR